MNDRYLYKAKRVDNGEWVEGFMVACDKRIFIAQKPECNTSMHMLDGYWMGTYIEIDPSTICQCTGLKDKDGKEIYEGDIVKNHMTDGRINSEEKDYIFEVVWCSSEASFEYRTKADILGNPCCVASNQYRVEIIGNIYENPEVLEMEGGHEK